MTTRPEIAFEDLPLQTEELASDAEILVSVGGTELRSPISLLPVATPPAPPASPTIERFDVTGTAAPVAGSIAGDGYSYQAAMGRTTRISVARVVGFVGAAPHPAAITTLATIASTDYAGATGSVSIPAGISLSAGQTYTLRLQVFEVGQQLTEEPVAYSDYQITAQASGAAGLNRGQVDARIRALVDALYLAGATDDYPDTRIPTDIARVSQITSAVAGLQSAAQVQAAITAALTDYRTATQIAALISGAAHIRVRGAWEPTDSYLRYDLAWTEGSSYLALRDINASTAATSQPGVGSDWTNDWLRLGYRSQAAPPSDHPLIERYTVTGTQHPAPGSIAGDSYSYSIALGNTARVGAARIVGFAGSAPHPSSPTALATIASSDYANATGSVTIPEGVSLTAGQTYTLRLEVYETGQTVATDQPYIYHDYQITAIAPAAHPSITSYTVTGDAHPTAGSIAGDTYSAAYALAHTDRIAAARVVGYIGSTSHPAKNAVTALATISDSDYESGTVELTVPDGVSLTTGQVYTLRLEVYETGQDVATDQAQAQADYQITAIAPLPDPTISEWTVAGEQSPVAGSITGDRYTYRYGIGGTTGVGAARTVGFKGAYAKANVHQFLSIPSANYASGHAVAIIPSGVSLAEGETYTLRLEVYKPGQAVATDEPFLHRDFVITAGAAPPTTMAHFGWVTAAQDETDIDFDTTDQATAASAVGYSWAITGVPAIGTYRMYAVVPADATQPTHFTVNNRVQDVLFPSVGDHDYDDDSYTVYLSPTFYAIDHTYNGQTVVIS